MRFGKTVATLKGFKCKNGEEAAQRPLPRFLYLNSLFLDFYTFHFGYQEMHDCPGNNIGKSANNKHDEISGC